MSLVMRKRGQEMSISTLVLIVIAIIVLVLVVIGFTGGLKNLWDRITNLGGGKSNVQSIIQACQVACAANSQYDYCSLAREINFGKGGFPEKKQVEVGPQIPPDDTDGDGKVKATCRTLEEHSGRFNIDLSCDAFTSACNPGPITDA